MFLAMLGLYETNALMAYRYTIGFMERFEWLLKLADALNNNPWIGEDPDNASDSDADADRAPKAKCGNQVYFTAAAKCHDCGTKTHYKCGCGVRCCRAGGYDPKAAKACYFKHL